MKQSDDSKERERTVHEILECVLNLEEEVITLSRAVISLRRVIECLMDKEQATGIPLIRTTGQLRALNPDSKEAGDEGS